jgi:shikimate dehydrogenase
VKKLFGVIGDPIEHSMSPLMHNELLNLEKIDAHYFPFHVSRENLPAAVDGLRVLGASGFNVTVPHKVAIMPLLDRIDPLASAIGAVNTVVNESGQFVGYNTDGSGFVRGLTTQLSQLEKKSVLMVGSGGAARAIYFTLAKTGVSRLDIFNRTISKAQKLIDECPYQVPSKAMEKNETKDLLKDYDIIIQTTSIGMSPKMAESPLRLNHLSEQAFVSDIIYNPLETLFLKEARNKGAKTQNGIDMFVFQGALAFEKWTGIFPDTERMKVIVNKQLGGTIC